MLLSAYHSAKAFAARNDRHPLTRAGRTLITVCYVLNRKISPLVRAVFASVADFLHIPWARPLTWRANILVARLWRVVEAEQYNAAEAARISNRIINLCRRATIAGPSESDHLKALARQYYLRGDMAASFDTAAAAFKMREDAFQASGLNRLGFRLIPPRHFLRTIGNTAQIESYVRAIQTGMMSPFRLVLPLHPEVKRALTANRAIIDYWRKYIDVVEDKAEIGQLEQLNKLIYVDPNTIELNGRVLSQSHAALAFTQHKWDSDGRGPLFTITPEHREAGERQLRAMGLAPSDWFVCLHVRCGGFNGDEPFRQAPIEDYMEAVQAITERGGWVIRMGDSSMAPMPPMPRTIEYALSDYKSPEMDVFLCATCRFFIATSSGLYHLADNFGRPFIQTNLLPTCAAFFGPPNLFIPKRLRSRDTSSELSIREVMSLNASAAASTGIVRNVLGLEWINNRPDEIRDVVVEMMNSLDGSVDYTAEESARQSAFRAMTAESKTLIGLENFPIRCRIGQQFLNQSNL